MPTRKPGGVPPKRDSQRRRSNKPAQYGAADPITAGQAAPQPELGFAAHELVASMWESLAISVEGRFYSHADWQRARMELFHANKLIRGRGRISATAWVAFQAGLSALLISPADKRRIGIELNAATADEDEDAAVVQMAAYQDKLTGS